VKTPPFCPRQYVATYSIDKKFQYANYECLEKLELYAYQKGNYSVKMAVMTDSEVNDRGSIPTRSW